ncbi:class I SAM-dependent methyltransferase [Halovenus sp. HT40]|uniref:class I SAM-dependent methyltransferase n=1 Tax=Halovenus sp. HT40 TaxID=3126691 RepID=UPI00300EDAD8
MTTWDERFENGEYPTNPDPSPVLRAYLPDIPDGRALDLATGTGRNAVFLADEGYTVDAIDQSRAGLRITRENAADRGVEDRIQPIQADIPTYEFPTDRYDLITISFYRAVDRFPDIKEALTEGGYLFVEHHLRSTESTPSGPSSDRYRFGANELLNGCLDLTVLHYDATTEERPEDKRRASARILARSSSGQRQSYPRRHDPSN